MHVDAPAAAEPEELPPERQSLEQQTPEREESRRPADGERPRRERRKQQKSSLPLILGGLLGVLGIGLAFLFLTGGPGKPEDAVEKFRELWNANDLGGLAEMTPAVNRAEWAANFDKTVLRYQWTAGLPKLERSLFMATEDKMYDGAFESEDGGLGVSFRQQNDRWEVVYIDYRNLTY